MDESKYLKDKQHLDEKHLDNREGLNERTFCDEISQQKALFCIINLLYQC
jgi:hypothetical protein